MYLQLDTRFNPFTYDEMVKPLLYYKQAYDEAEAAYSDLATQTEAWKDIANRERSPEAFEMYQRYSGDLSRAVDDFSQGMTAKNRRALLGLKRRYARDIQPIADAYKRRSALAEEQRKAIAANPTLRYQRMAGQMSLDDFIRNPSLDYGESYSGALLTQQVSQAAANLQRALTDKGQLQKLGLPYQYERMLQYGATPSQVLAAMAEQAQNEPETASFLRGIVDQVMQSSGVADWADPATLREFRAFANQGLYSAIGQAKLDNFTDQFSMQGALNARQHARQVEAQRNAEEQQRLKMYNINPTTLYGTSEVTAKNKSTLDLLTKFRDKGYFNAQGQLTKEGVKALQDAKYVEKSQRGPTGYVKTKHQVGDWEFKNWALKHGHSQKGIDAGYASPTLNRYYQNTMAAINKGELVIGTPNIDVYRQGIRDETTQKYLLRKTTAALKGGDIYPVGDLTHSENGIIMGRGEGISAAEFEKLATDNPILYIINSPTTNNQLIELSNGDKFIMPTTMLDNTNQDDLNSANQKIMNSASLQETAVNLNQANSYLGSLLDYNEGTGITTSDGTIIF